MLAQEIAAAIETALHEAMREGQPGHSGHPSLRTYLGKHQEQLAADLCRLTQQAECCLFSSATAGLEVLLRALQIGPDHEVLMAGYDYPGNFGAIERVGARPVLVDVEDQGWQMELDQVEHALRQPNHRIKALVVSHLYGELQNSERLKGLCESAGVSLIEDCCQVIGAKQSEGSPVGKQAQAMLLSFGGGKTISCGRGGALLTSDPQLAQRIRIASGAGSGAYGLSEVQALMVVAQLPYLEQIHERCRQVLGENHQQLQEDLTQALKLYCPAMAFLHHTSFYQYGWLVQDSMESDRDAMPTSTPPPSEPTTVVDLLTQNLKQAGLLAGRGFPGFHRRTERRCRKLSKLSNSARRAHETLVVHHEFALRPDDHTHHLAREILASLNEKQN